MVRMATVALVTLALVLAGCSDDGSPATASGDGAGSGAAGGDEGPTRTETITVTEMAETPVDWSGSTVEGVWVCQLPGCPYGHLVQDPAYQTTIDFEGDLTAISLTIDWTPADATQTGLVLSIQAPNGTQIAYGEDTSSFTVDGPLDVEGQQLLLQVWPSAKDGGSTFIDVTRQPFTVSGTLTTVVERTEQVEVPA
ncbi:MAG: hypothetical protein ACPGQL_00100 [Thermoplasmatota archaeon]